jgi:hypothetical protein
VTHQQAVPQAEGDNPAVGSDDTSRGCALCADPGNLSFGHVNELASNASRRSVLLQCPCSSAYDDEFRQRARDTRRLTADDVTQLFPDVADGGC